jgi:CS domain/Sel1 repeat
MDPTLAAPQYRVDTTATKLVSFSKSALDVDRDAEDLDAGSSASSSEHLIDDEQPLSPPVAGKDVQDSVQNDHGAEKHGSQFEQDASVENEDAIDDGAGSEAKWDNSVCVASLAASVSDAGESCPTANLNATINANSEGYLSLDADTDAADQAGSGDEAGNDLDNVVEEFIESVVHTASFAVSVQAERDNVQSVINNLVLRATRKAAGDAAASELASSPPDVAPTPSPETASAPAPTPKGIPYGDVRSWSVAKPQSTPDDYAAIPVDMFWAQTSDTVTLTIILPANLQPSARDVRVVFNQKALSVSVAGQSVLSEKLGSAVDADSCLWSLDRSSPHAPTLVLELEKSKPQWWPILFESHDPAVYVLYQPGSSQPGHSPSIASESVPASSPPPPPPPQAVSHDPDANTQPPDRPPPTLQSSAAAKLPTDDSTADKNEPEGPLEKVNKDELDDEDVRRTGPSTSRASQPPTRVDLDRIILQYKTAFEKGGPGAGEAAMQLATFYHHGIGVPQNNTEAARLYLFAMSKGVVDNSAAFQLGLIYNQGCEGLPADPSQAVRWWTVSARLGNAVAMFNLGVMYMNGSGCTMDPQVAMRFFQQAHALNPQLRPPEFTAAQFADRIAQASRVKKLKQKASLSEEERHKRHEQAMETLRYTVYGGLTVVTVSITAVLVRSWWRNRL